MTSDMSRKITSAAQAAAGGATAALEAAIRSLSGADSRLLGICKYLQTSRSLCTGAA